MSTDEALFAHLKQLVGDDSAEPWSDDNIAYFFQRFRPDGEGVEAAFSLLPDASAYVSRLLPVYRATKHDQWERDMYFVIRDPAPLGESEVVALGHRFLANLRDFAGIIGHEEFTSYLASVTTVRIVPPGTLDRSGDDNLLLYDTIGDFLGYHVGHHPLHEVYYSIACDFDLLWYLAWPYYGHLCPIDCFEPYFRLWQHGFGYAFDGPTLNIAR